MLGLFLILLLIRRLFLTYTEMVPRENGSFISVRDTTSREGDAHVAEPSTNTIVDVSVYHPVESHVYRVEIEESLVFKVDIAPRVVRRVHFVLRQTNIHAPLNVVRKCSQETGATDVTAVHAQCTIACVQLGVI